MMAKCWLAAALVTAIVLAQSGHRGRRWARYEAEMQNPADDPPDAWEQTEFAFARLRYRSGRGGYWRARWGIDANKSERQFLQGLRRLTRVHARSVEQIVDIDSDEIYDWPWLYAVGIGDWTLNSPQAERLRKYFERGGFLMVDDFHNEWEWSRFMAGMELVMPAGQLVELPDDAPIFQTVFDLSHRVRVPGLNVVHGDQIERGGVYPHWRAILDDRGRVVVAICFNMDLGDAWEWADLPEYPEQYASLAYRIGINYIIYSMTH
ncbi:MAG: DUF4159 domain-containing protein [Acidobacteriia bacterium]|nr:DUF4159 domain-containing protein [Terriglobia bacterium]